MSFSDIKIPLPAGGALPTYLAQPQGRSSGVGIVLLQEIFGVNANMRAIADDYAARGFDAIVPDLFWRQEPGVRLDPASAADRERATALMKGLNVPLALDDALAAAQHLRSLQGASGKVVAVGYCLGGKLAYLLATRPGIDGAVSYYGVAIHGVLDKAQDIRCPLLLHIAGEDPLCPPEAQAAIKQALEPRSNVIILDYPGVGHAFARRGASAFNSTAAELADKATATFLAQTLEPAPR
jgi:carboxymethylenebutenolidase